MSWIQGHTVASKPGRTAVYWPCGRTDMVDQCLGGVNAGEGTLLNKGSVERVERGFMPVCLASDLHLSVYLNK